jgi:hypothetical protein
MGKITSIAQVQDLYDLMDLFANRDVNADGWLGPDELPAEHIVIGDQEGNRQDHPDGYLQPWEVMEMRGTSIFKKEEIAHIKACNTGTTWFSFPSIASLPRDVEIGGTTYKEKTGLAFHISTHGSRVMSGVLAKPTRLPSTPAILLPAGSHILHRYEGAHIVMSSVTLSEGIVIDGNTFPKGTSIDLEGGALIAASHRSGGIAIQNALYQSVSFKSHVLESGELVRSTMLPVRKGRCYPFQDRVYFRPDGMVKNGTLSMDVPSPYGGQYIHRAGSSVDFSKDGLLIEATPEGFRALFPTIALSGLVSQDDIRAAIAAFSTLNPQTLACIKGLHFGYDDLPTPFVRSKQRGYANPFNNTIYIRKGKPLSPDTRTDIIHESAHMRHIALQKETMRRIAAATRHLDPTKPSELIEDHAIGNFIFSRSFDAQWSQAAGYDFHFSIADLFSYLRNFNAHSAIAAGLVVDEPAMGFMSSYGHVSIWEDVATQVEAIHKNPDLYRDLIDPDSDYYQDKPDQRAYARVYRAKLDLLRTYGFIAEQLYRDIVPMHERMRTFCQIVNCP